MMTPFGRRILELLDNYMNDMQKSWPQPKPLNVIILMKCVPSKSVPFVLQRPMD